MPQNNRNMLNEYLASRHTDQAVTILRKEYYCKTCVQNVNIEKLRNFEKTHSANYIPKQIRRLVKIGSIFTHSSSLYEWHANNPKNHDWGEYQPAIKPLNVDI